MLIYEYLQVSHLVGYTGLLVMVWYRNPKYCYDQQQAIVSFRKS